MNSFIHIFVGNDAIHKLTKKPSSLYISITLNNGTTFFELYEIFSISSEADNYRLFIGGQATGTLGMLSLTFTNVIFLLLEYCFFLII